MKSLPRHAASSLTFLLALAAPLVTACSGGGSTDAGNLADASDADVPVRNDFINVNCTSTAGDEDAVNCNARLMTMTGAHFFIGGASQCLADPNDPACTPLCQLAEINGTNCTFAMGDAGTPGIGCRYNQSEGYRVVVEAPNGNRWSAAVSADGQCTLVGTSFRKWARVRFDDLTGAAACAASMPAGGLGPPRYESCDTPMAACGTASGDTCQTLDFMGPTGPYQANMCTHSCTSDADCGGRGSCYNQICWAICGGACALSCTGNFGCQMPMGANTTICLPRPMQ